MDETIADAVERRRDRIDDCTDPCNLYPCVTGERANSLTMICLHLFSQYINYVRYMSTSTDNLMDCKLNRACGSMKSTR